MSDCQNGCGKTLGMTELRRDLKLLRESGKNNHVPEELIAAVVLRESGGNRWFSVRDALYRQNLKAATAILTTTPERLLSYITPKEGPSKGLIPKFRAESSWLSSAVTHAGWTKEPVLWRCRLAMSFGYGQKSMLYYLSQKPVDQWNKLFFEFTTNPQVQLKQVADDLEGLIKRANGHVRLALTRYNTGPGAKTVSEYGERVFALYRTLANSDL